MRRNFTTHDLELELWCCSQAVETFTFTAEILNAQVEARKEENYRTEEFCCAHEPSPKSALFLLMMETHNGEVERRQLHEGCQSRDIAMPVLIICFCLYRMTVVLRLILEWKSFDEKALGLCLKYRLGKECTFRQTGEAELVILGLFKILAKVGMLPIDRL
ncbi:hypothetical protein Tco_0506666 [Tanacetum coccineum]